MTRAGASLRGGGALIRTFVVWVAGLPQTAAFVAIAYAPALAVHVLVPFPRDQLGVMATFLADRVAELLLVTFVVSRAVPRLRGEPAGLGPSLDLGFRRLLPVVGATACLLCAFLPASLPLWVARIAIRHPVAPVRGGFAALLVIAALCLLARVACSLSVTLPVAIHEHRGPIGSLVRSGRLCRGHKWGVFCVLAVLFVVQHVVADGVRGAGFTPVLAGLVEGPLLLALHATAMAVVYQELRREQEGVGTAELARVFE